jgi:signal peptidase I
MMSSSESSSRRGGSSVISRALLRLFWFTVIPLLWVGLLVRYLVPHSRSAHGFEGALAAAAQGRLLLVGIALFVALGLLLRYWRLWLPGGRYLSSIPDEIAKRVPRRRVALCEAACALFAELDTPQAKRRLLASSSEQRALVAASQEALRTQLAAGKWSKIEPALNELRRLTARSKLAASTGHTLLFAALLAGAAVLALQLRSRFIQAYDVIGTSMLPTLTPGELLLGERVAYAPGQLPRRGDLVVLRVEVDGREQEVIKRVIGLPGDHLGMTGAHPAINGWDTPLCDTGAYYSPTDETARSGDPGSRMVMEFLEGAAYLTLQAVPAAAFPEYIVKPGELFVLGDNRSNSRDSRNFDHGAPRAFPLSSVRAKVTRVLLGRSNSGEIEPRTLLRSIGIVPRLDGADLTEVETKVANCLAVRPHDPTPPGPPSIALASGVP